MTSNQFYVVGTSHKTSTLALREGLARIKGGETAVALQAIQEDLEEHLSEVCLLSTCNRYEVYAVGPEGLDESLKAYLMAHLDKLLHPFCEEGIYTLSNAQAVEHLFSVTSGLDSMVLGESEILGQVKTAYELAQRAGATKTILNTAFQRALAVGKKIRSETKISEGRLSVASVAIELAGKIFSDFSSVYIAIVGSGVVGTEVARGLLHAKPKGQIFLSRTFEHAEELAIKFGGKAATLEELPGVLASSDVVVTQLSLDYPLITEEMVSRASSQRLRPLFILDIALPRNVDEKVATISNTYLYNIDDLKAIAQANYAKRKNEVDLAKSIVQQEVAQFLPRLSGVKPSGWVAGVPASL